MYISTLEYNPILVLELDGRLDGEGAVQLEQLLQTHYETQAHSAIILNLSGVNYVNSSGLRVLARFLKLSNEIGCQLRLINITPNVGRAMEMVGLSHYFPYYATLEEALEL